MKKDEGRRKVVDFSKIERMRKKRARLTGKKLLFFLVLAAAAALICVVVFTQAHEVLDSRNFWQNFQSA